MTLDLLALVAGLALGPGGQSERPAHPQPPTIRVVGEATVTAPPDQVEIDIGVTTQASSSKHASVRNAEQSSRIVRELKTALEPTATIETISYMLTPDYRFPKESAAPTVGGYTATNIVRVTTHDLAHVGEIATVR